ncbi:hypothetical protein [Novosphingobium sp. MD-1]|uniref:hypothetical protein n=1 Tax=Novosphingobium sp. MD-1 TaxID=1630648 RepID=UPI00061BAC40|nr:hypothetical protein [Novosphingobium sp. MD-1]GAO52960.1 hypothetical protein NMD1_02617 [Novosphingobium sp. MD-1]
MHDDDRFENMTPQERAEFEAKIEASINTHSGHPTVTVQEWAALVRCRADRPVPVDELVASMYRWFVPFLSAQEFADLIYGQEDKGWLAITQDEEGMRYAQTTLLGEEVLAAAERPLMLAGVFRLTGKDSIPQGLGDEGGLQSLPKPGSGGRRGDRRPPDHRPDRR